ncbi:MAG: STAS domain-containing protein [Actinobacteria bacterium]|nr:MAG: STAS domain-containing protein [Actinomycetota bacterium]
MTVRRPTTIVCDVGALVEPDVGTIDALARFQLAARRFGCEIRLRHASADFQQLLALMGLDEVLLRVEPSRQAEEREQRLGVEEERELDDPTL